MATPEPPPEPPQSFDTKEAAMKWVLDSNSTRFKRATTTRSDTTRVYYKCVNETCNFSFHVRRSVDGLFRVSEWRWHTFDPLSTARVKPAWAVLKAKDLLARKKEMKPKVSIRPSHRSRGGTGPARCNESRVKGDEGDVRRGSCLQQTPRPL